MVPAIKIDRLRVEYEGNVAVHDVSFEVMPGEVFGLIGPNGAGKTTTFRAMLGLLETTHGDIRIEGRDVRKEVEETNRIVGFMPDYVPLYEDLTVHEFLDLFAASYEVPRQERGGVIDRHLRMVELQEKRDAPVGSLSRGMRQRLMLAKTLIPNPRVLLLDEPASGMDPHGRIMLRNLLIEQSKLGRAAIVSSHILTEMAEFCTSVGIMERGRMVVSGSINDVAARVTGGDTLAIEVLEGRDRLELALADRGTLVWRDRVAELTFAGDDSAAADLLAELVSAGVRISSFGRRRSTLEEIFLKVGSRGVS
jgi:ABC-2 type transport system ATP-binding protein